MVLPGLIVSLPLCVLTGFGLWLQWRSMRRHVERVTDQQTHQFRRITDRQTRLLGVEIEEAEDDRTGAST